MAAKIGNEDESAGVPGVQALTRGILIVDRVAAAAKGLRFTELLERTQLPKGTLHRLLQALVEERLLAFDENDQAYRLASKVFHWAHKVWDDFDLRGAAEPELERLRDLAGEAVRLAVLDGDDLLTIDQRDTAQPLRLGSGVGARGAPQATALGKAILSHLPPEKRQRHLRRIAQTTGADEQDLGRQLDLVKAHGYAISTGDDGIASVAAPVTDHRGEPIGAIGIIGPSFRLPQDRLHAFGREVIEAARRTAGNYGEFVMSIAVGPKPMGSERADVSCAIPASCFLGEGPHWSTADRKLFFVDILAPAVCVGDIDAGAYETIAMPELTGFAIPRREGGLVVGIHNEIASLDTPGSKLTTLAQPEADRPGNRFNDGKCDRRGRLWAGSLAIDTTPDRGSLWRIDADGRADEMARGIHVSNGLGWSPDDKTFYFTDTGRRTIYAYDYDIERGEIANRRSFVAVPEAKGKPDGLTVDAEGCLWVALWDGWCVVRYDPDGKVERVITLPVPRPTSCTFGGDDLATLFVTTARIRLSANQLAEAPLSGSVLAVQTGIKGIPDMPFG